MFLQKQKASHCSNLRWVVVCFSAVAACCVSNNALILNCKLQETLSFIDCQGPQFDQTSVEFPHAPGESVVAERCIWQREKVSDRHGFSRLFHLGVLQLKKKTSFFVPIFWDSTRKRAFSLSQSERSQILHCLVPIDQGQFKTYLVHSLFLDPAGVSCLAVLQMVFAARWTGRCRMCGQKLWTWADSRQNESENKMDTSAIIWSYSSRGFVCCCWWETSWHFICTTTNINDNKWNV